MDLRAFLETPIELKPSSARSYPRACSSNFRLVMKRRCARAAVSPRNVALRYSTLPGTIDADYRGEVKVILVNLSNETFRIEDGERVAQLVVARHERVEWTDAEELSLTDRGTGGFGSTGK